MKTQIAIISSSLASKYVNLDNYTLQGTDIPDKFILEEEDNSFYIIPFNLNNNTLEFLKLSIENIDSMISFDTIEPTTFGTNFVMKLVALHDNAASGLITIHQDYALDKIYVFKDESNTLVYIPESIIIEDSIVIEDIETCYMVKCKSKSQATILKRYMNSLGCTYTERKC